MRIGHKILYELASVRCLLFAILLLIVISYCCWMSVHYHLNHYTSSEITSKPLDYFGLIAGFFALLITLLVGWQIWQTIVSRDEVQNLMQENKELKECFDEKINKIYKDINEHVELRNKNHLEIIKQVKDDYESSINVLFTMLYLRDYKLPHELVKYAIEVLKIINDPVNIKTREAFKAIEVSISDIINDKASLKILINNVPIEDIYWLRSIDYSEKKRMDQFDDFGLYLSNLDKIIRAYQI